MWVQTYQHNVEFANITENVCLEFHVRNQFFVSFLRNNDRLLMHLLCYFLGSAFGFSNVRMQNSCPQGRLFFHRLRAAFQCSTRPRLRVSLSGRVPHLRLTVQQLITTYYKVCFCFINFSASRIFLFH